ncbi:hypothetical protein A2U01_0078122, partial [Trifolium medium]|nr:hypothetical protein [Trifolium medium]
HELYVESLNVPNVDPAVVASAGTTVSLSDEFVKSSETLDLGDPKSDVNLGKDDLDCSDKANIVDDGSEKANVESVTETVQETVAMINAEASV